DAALALMAEIRFGAGRGIDDVLYLNGSVSGIGGAAFVGGRPMVGADGFAGEFGHTLVRSDGDTCDCGRRGCLETEVNVQRLAASTRLAEHPADALHLDLREATGDLADEVERQADVLATAIANLVGAFNPSTVILGGFLGSLHEARPEAIATAVHREAFAPLAESITIVSAELGEDIHMVGAAELAFAPLLVDPLGTLGTGTSTL